MKGEPKTDGEWGSEASHPYIVFFGGCEDNNTQFPMAMAPSWFVSCFPRDRRSGGPR